MAKRQQQCKNDEKNCDDYDPSRRTGISAEDKKKRRREYYAKNAEKIREQSRIKMAEKRAAIKAQRRKSDKPRRPKLRPDLTKDELAASEVLTQMQELQRKQRTESHWEGVGSTSQRGNSGPNPLAIEEAGIDKEIDALVEKGMERLSDPESSSEDGVEYGDDDREHEPDPESDVPEISVHRIRAQQLKHQRALRLGRLRLPSPASNSPSPEPEGPLPSFYDKLWATMKKR